MRKGERFPFSVRKASAKQAAKAWGIIKTVPRQLIAKGQTRFDGFDDKILSLYAAV